MTSSDRTPLQLDVREERWASTTPLKISGHQLDNLALIVARLSDREHFGEGEAAGVYYHHDTTGRLKQQLEAVASEVAGLTREAVQALLPPGGARNALDCALWALNSKRAKTPAWRLAGCERARPLLTTFTIGAEPPSVCAERAARWVGRGARALKQKLNGDGSDLARVRAIRAEAPNAWIGVDANQGWTLDDLKALAPALAGLDVRLIEQPLPVSQDEALRGYVSPVPLAADESFQDSADLERLAGLYQVANIKLDKCGGLTEALRCVDLGRRLGFEVMVGNMGGTSLAMAPAFVAGQFCDVVDLDGPIYFVADREPATVYRDGYLERPKGWDYDVNLDTIA